MTFTDIDVYLAAWNVDTSKETYGGSKWVYVKELLAGETDATIEPEHDIEKRGYGNDLRRLHNDLGNPPLAGLIGGDDRR